MTWEELIKADADAYSAQLKRERKHHEDNLQIQCVRWMQLQYPQWAQLLHHSPNGGARSKVEGAIFKKMGVRAGFPDLIFCHANSHYHALFIEMKTHEKGSSQSNSQKQWQKMLTDEGYLCTVCKDLEQFSQTIKDYINDKQ